MEQNNYYNEGMPETYQTPDIQKQIDDLANEAFSKSLAATIMAEFPVASIIAISSGNKGLRLAKEARELAERTGHSAGGKAVAAKILGLIGKIGGIVCTALYAFVVVYYIFIVAMIASSSYYY